MRAQAAGKQAVAVGNLHNVVFAHVGAVHGAGHQLCPAIHVAAGVTGHAGLAGSAGGCMNAHNFALRHGEEAERIVVAQILLFGKGQKVQVLHAMDVLGRDAQLLHLVAVEGHVFVNAAHHVAQPLILKGAQLLAGHGFHCGIPVFMLHGAFLLTAAWATHSGRGRARRRSG